MIFTSQPQNYSQYNKETNGYTQDTIFSLTPMYSSELEESFLTAYRIINRKRYNISLVIDSLHKLENKITLLTLFNDDDFMLFSDQTKEI